MVMAHDKKEGTLYMTSGSEASIQLLHRSWMPRLGHMSEKGMKVMLSKDKLPGLST